MPSIELHSANLSYGQQQVFNDLSLQIPEGKLTALIGPNGSGKSTLLRVIAGLLMLDTGRLSLDGQGLRNYSARELAKIRAFLPQHPITPEAMTVEQLVECGRFAYQGLFASANQEDKEAVQWAMAKCGVSQFSGKLVSTLSGGERQRVWVASALAQKAPLILLDEPCSYLDISYQLDLMQLLRQIVDEQHLTIVMSSHDINHCAQFADHMVAVSGGSVAASGPVDQVLDGELVATLFGVQTEFFQSPRSGKQVCAFHALPRTDTQPDISLVRHIAE